MTTTEKVLIGAAVLGGGFLAWKHFSGGHKKRALGDAEREPGGLNQHQITTQGKPKGIKDRVGGAAANLGSKLFGLGKTAATDALNGVGARYGQASLGSVLLA